MNTYIGGGETLAIKVCEYLKSQSFEYSLIVSKKRNCWLRAEAKRKKLDFIEWPLLNESILYQNKKEKTKIVEYFSSKFKECVEMKILTICMQDFYNACFIFNKISSKSTIKIVHGIYHPEDTYYLSNFTIHRDKVRNENVNNMGKAFSENGLIFVNENAIKTVLPKNYWIPASAQNNFISLPINLSQTKRVLQRSNFDQGLKIIMISRFTEFKVGAVLSVLRHVRSQRDIDMCLIGYGAFGFIIKIWILINSSERITFLGKVSPDQLDKHIRDADIGIAQGTSILEIAKCGKPVIIAPYSRLIDIFVNKYGFLGIFGDVIGGAELGDIRHSANIKSYQLSHLIHDLRSNYRDYCAKTQNRIREYDQNVIAKRIVGKLNKSNFTGDDISYPRPSIFRVLRSIIYKVVVN